MTEINQKLLQLILDGKSTQTILETLKLTPKQLKIRLQSLKNSGYNFEYNISDNGQITYKPLLGTFHNATNTIDLNLEKDKEEFTFLAISDMHIGHKLDCLENLDLIYEYAKQNNINIIVNCGDVIEGCCNNESESTIRKQVEKLIQNHPFDKDVLNLTLFGNHDYTPLEKYNINISDIITAERSDFVSLGFGTGIINIENSQIIIFHPVKHSPCYPNFRFPSNWVENKLVLKGHGHHNSIKTTSKRCILKVPTISNVIYSQTSSLPGAVKITMHLDEEGNLKVVNAENLVITRQIYTAGYFKHTFNGKSIILGENKLLSKQLKRTT